MQSLSREVDRLVEMAGELVELSKRGCVYVKAHRAEGKWRLDVFVAKRSESILMDVHAEVGKYTLTGEEVRFSLSPGVKAEIVEALLRELEDTVQAMRGESPAQITLRAVRVASLVRRAYGVTLRPSVYVDKYDGGAGFTVLAYSSYTPSPETHVEEIAKFVEVSWKMGYPAEVWLKNVKDGRADRVDVSMLMATEPGERGPVMEINTKDELYRLHLPVPEDIESAVQRLRELVEIFFFATCAITLLNDSKLLSPLTTLTYVVSLLAERAVKLLEAMYPGLHLCTIFSNANLNVFTWSQ